MNEKFQRKILERKPWSLRFLICPVVLSKRVFVQSALGKILYFRYSK